MNLSDETSKTVPSSKLTAASRYTVVNGAAYMTVGALLIAWPGVVQSIFREPPFVGHEVALMRVIGLTVLVIGWLYVFGGRSGSRPFIVASIVDRLAFLPLVLLPLAFAGVFPHLFFAFAILDAALALGAWVLLGRK
jgi:hypothetical protein